MSYVDLPDTGKTREIPVTVRNVADSVCDKGKRYFLPSEVVVHNSEDDCWVSYNGGVYDLTDLCKEWAGRKEILPLLAHAGKDISHWFDHEKNDIKYHMHPVTGVLVPYCPHGPIPDVIPHVVPASSWRPLDKCPWWFDEKYRKGYLTKNPRPCRLLNVLTGTEIATMVKSLVLARTKRAEDRYVNENPKYRFAKKTPLDVYRRVLSFTTRTGELTLGNTKESC